LDVPNTPMNNSPLDKAIKRLRFSELRRDGQRNRVLNLVKQTAVLNATLDIERDRLEHMKHEVKENYKTLIQIRDGKTL